MHPSGKRRDRGWQTVYVLFVAVIVAPDVASRSEAAEWSLSPSLGAKGVFNSNLLLTPLPHDETYGYWVTPAAEFAGKTERLEVSSRIAADFASYFGGEERRFTNIFVPLSLRYGTEKDLIGFTGGFVRDNTLMGELQATGVVLQFTQRDQWTANPTWTRKLTERFSFRSGLQFTDTTYEGGLQSSLVDYRLLGGSGGLLYQLTEQDQIELSGSYMDFRTTNTASPFRANFPGASVSFTHAFTESVTGTVYGGPRFLYSDSPTASGNITTRDTVWIGGASITRNFERAALQASVSRDLVPSGFGLIIETNRGEVSGSYSISETVVCSLNVVGVLTSGITQPALGGTFPDRRYVSATPKISWKFLEWWQAELSYMYRWQDVDTAVDSAQSHATTFMVTYYPPKLAFSR